MSEALLIRRQSNGNKLPLLLNPGSGSDLLDGKQLIGQNGEIITGSIATKTTDNVSVNNSTITIPMGYYPQDISKSINTTTQATPSISVDSAGKITASATQEEGYVVSGTKSATKQLTTKAATTITPSGTEQTAIASGTYATGDIKVAAIPTVTQATPSISVDSAGKITASATQSAGYVVAGTKSATKQLTTKAATIITPGTSNKTAIASGTYATGTITVAGDSDLKAENIKSGINIFGIAGTYEGETPTTVTQATPSISINSSGVITASATQDEGYVSAGTKSATKQLTTKAATTITPTTSEQTAVASGVYTTGIIKVAAMPTATQATPSISVDSAGKITASSTQIEGYVSAGTKSATKQLTTKAAATITPGTSSKTIAAGTYLTGTQTIAGDADLKAANIKKGVNIFGVAGSYDAVELNFKVVGGTTQPSNPTENTIWVNTSTTITSYVFSATQPTGSAGMVWIHTGMARTVEFNALKENSIMTYPTSANQYIGGVWVGVMAMSYQGGEWKDWATYIVDGSTTVNSSKFGTSVLRGAVTFGSGRIVATFSGSNTAYGCNIGIWTKTTIDVKEKTKVNVVLKCSNTYTNTNYNVLIGVSQSIPSAWGYSGCIATTTAYFNTDEKKYSLDISNLAVDEVYLYLGPNQPGYSGSNTIEILEWSVS